MDIRNDLDLSLWVVSVFAVRIGRMETLAAFGRYLLFKILLRRGDLGASQAERRRIGMRKHFK